MLYIPLLIFFVIARAYSSLGSNIDYRISLDGVLDNREYGFGPLIDQTFFFTQGEAELGLYLFDAHKINGGIIYTMEFGAPDTAHNRHTLFYYQYENTWASDMNARFLFGAFPRATSALELPEWLFGQESEYYRPYIHGAVARLGIRDVKFGAWVDWTARRTNTVREAFLFGYYAKYHGKLFFVKHDFIMYHLAGTSSSCPSFQYKVRDNGGASVEVGLLGGSDGNIDAASFSVGGIVSLDRDRGWDNVWYTPVGGFFRASLTRGFLEVRGFGYAGAPQRLIWGHDFYRPVEVRNSPRSNWADAYFRGFLWSNGFETFGRLDLAIRSHRQDNTRHIKAEFFQSFYTFGNTHFGLYGEKYELWPRKYGHSQHFLLHAELRKGG